jgi:hypothetical protein
MRARVSRKLHDRLEGLPQIVRNIALESAGPALFPLSSARGDGQAQGRRDDCNRAGDGGIFYGRSQARPRSVPSQDSCVGKQIGVHGRGRGAVENPRAFMSRLMPTLAF